MSRKLMISTIIYSIVAIVLFIILAFTASEQLFKTSMVCICMPVIIVMCIFGIKVLINDLTELRFNLLYRSRLKSDFKRLVKAARIYTERNFRHGILNIVHQAIYPAIFGVEAYFLIFYILLGRLFNGVIPIAIAIILFILGWFDTVVRYGMYQLEDDQNYPLTWY